MFRFILLASLGLFLSGCDSQPKPAVKPPAPPLVVGEFGFGDGQFKGPRALATDEKYLYVADRASRISKFTKDGKFVMRWSVPVRRNGSFEGPEGIAVLRSGELAITNTHSSRVLIYSKTGELLRKFGSYGEGQGQFLLVTGVVAAPDGTLFCSDYGGEFDRVSHWTKDGKLLASWPGHGEGPRQFRRPVGLALAQNGDLLVADAGNHRVQILDAKTGKFKGQFGPRGRGNGQLTYPYGVAVDGAGFVYTVEYGTHRVQKWSRDYKWLATWGAPGRKPGFLANPWGIAVEKDGTIWVADTNNDRVQRFRLQ